VSLAAEIHHTQTPTYDIFINGEKTPLKRHIIHSECIWHTNDTVMTSVTSGADIAPSNTLTMNLVSDHETVPLVHACIGTLE